jgi:hypothetical protein
VSRFELGLERFSDFSFSVFCSSQCTVVAEGVYRATYKKLALMAVGNSIKIDNFCTLLDGQPSEG